MTCGVIMAVVYVIGLAIFSVYWRAGEKEPENILVLLVEISMILLWPAIIIYAILYGIFRVIFPKSESKEAGVFYDDKEEP